MHSLAAAVRRVAVLAEADQRVVVLAAALPVDLAALPADLAAIVAVSAAAREWVVVLAVLAVLAALGWVDQPADSDRRIQAWEPSKERDF